MNTLAYHLAQANDMDWAPHVMGTSIRKVLDLDPSNDSYVHLRYVPPEPAPLGRRLHLSINETFYFVSGDFPSWEYEHPDDVDGQLVMFRGGTFMDRVPYSIHGTRPEPVSQTGCTLLIWTSGGAEFEADPKESIQIPFDGTAPGFNAPFTMATVIDSTAMDWQPHPTNAGWRWRVLSTLPNDAGLTQRPVSVIYIPPDWQGAGLPAPVDHRAWMFVLSGGMTVSGDGPHDLMENTYFRWAAGAQPQFSKASPVGCTLLCVGHDLALP